MKKVLHVTFIMILLGSSLGFIDIQSAIAMNRAQEVETSPACYSLDVIFLIDQSPSMLDNDPLNLRKYAINWVIDWLGDNLLTSCKNAGVVHNIGVVSFGGSTRIDLQLTTISPSSRDDWYEYRTHIKADISDVPIAGTSPRFAFEEAEKLFAQASASGNTPRKRLIVFLTDGEPCTGEVGSANCNREYFETYAEMMYERVNNLFPFDENLLAQEQCLDEARLRFKDGDISPEAKYECLKNYEVEQSELYKSTYIWTVLLNKNEPYYSGFRNWIDRLSEEHAGETIPLIYNATGVPSTFLRIMSELVGVRAERIECGIFYMEPYLEQSTFTFFKMDPAITVNISYALDDATEYSISQEDLLGQATPVMIPGFNVNDYTQDSSIERYSFWLPKGGEWRISSSDCQGIEAFFQPLELTSGYRNDQAKQMYLPPFYDVDNPVYIEYFLRDVTGAGDRVAEDPDFPITISVNLLLPDGSQNNFFLSFDEGNQSFRSSKPLDVSLAGDYLVDIKATTSYADPNRSNETRLLLQEDNVTIRVVPTENFTYEYLLTQEIIPQVDIEPFYETLYPVYIQYRLQDSLGRDTTAGEDQNYPVEIFSVIERPDGNLDEQKLTFDTTEKVFRTESPLNVSLSGKYTVNSEAKIWLPDQSGQPTIEKPLFNDGPHTFDVLPVTPFTFKILTPAEDQTVTLHSGLRRRLALNRVQFKVALLSRDGAVLDPSEVLSEPLSALTSTLTANGITIPVTFTLDAESREQFLGVAQIIDFEGLQTFEVKYQGVHDRTQYRPDEPLGDSVTFVVKDSLFTDPNTYRVLSVLAIIGILIATVIIYLNRNNPVTGTLYIEIGTTSIAFFPLGSGWNVTRIRKRDLKPYEESVALQSLKAFKSSSVDGGVDYEAKDVDGTTYSGSLYPNAPTQFIGSMSIRYEPLDKYTIE